MRGGMLRQLLGSTLFSASLRLPVLACILQLPCKAVCSQQHVDRWQPVHGHGVMLLGVHCFTAMEMVWSSHTGVTVNPLLTSTA